MKQWKVFGLFVCCLLVFCGKVDAAKLDAYRKMMENHSFTLKYEIEVPDNYLDGVEMFVKDGKSYPVWHIDSQRTWDEMEQFMPPYKGVVVVNGNDRYSETIYRGGTMAYQYGQGEKVSTTIHDIGDSGGYFLQKSGEKFYYGSSYTIAWMFGGGKKVYAGMVGKDIKQGKIEAETYYPNPQDAMKCEYNYGHPIIGRILHAIYFDESFPVAYLPFRYELTDSGQLDDGLFYEDYVAEWAGTFYALRFYFNGDTLTKVSSASYKQTADGGMDESSYQAKTVHIKEFSPTPDVSYLSLPEGLKDVTKRDKKKAGGDE